MKLDEDGRLWTAGAGGVSVYEPDGHCLGQVETEEHAANLTFGGVDFSTLFLAAGTNVYSVGDGRPRRRPRFEVASLVRGRGGALS